MYTCTVKCLYVIGSICDSSPCDNGGTCSVVTNAVSCACVPGYSGDTCSGKFIPFVI